MSQTTALPAGIDNLPPTAITDTLIQDLRTKLPNSDKTIGNSGGGSSRNS